MMLYVIATGEIDDVWYLADMYDEVIDGNKKRTFYWSKNDYISFKTEFEAKQFIKEENIKRARWVVPTGIYLL